MLSPLFRSIKPSPLSLRPFTSSCTLYRSPPPSIRDITPDNAEAFNARQKEFRDNLEAARRKKAEQESQSNNASVSSSPNHGTSSASTAPKVSNAGGASRPLVDAAEHLDGKALGSLSTHRIVGEQRQSEINGQASGRGRLSSLIYGTKEGQQLDRDIERSFSEVLARGKYVHSIVFHTVKPDRVGEYVDLVGEWYPKMANTEENRVNLVGSWRTQVGDNETFGIHPVTSPSPPSSANPPLSL